MQKLGKKSISDLLTTYMLVIITVALGLIMTFSTKVFMTQTNLLNVLRQVSINGVLALGMTCVALTGGIDLSVGSVVALSGIVAAGLLRDSSLPIFLIILIALAIGLACGAINGYFVAYRNCPPFCTTLAMMTIARGLTFIYSNGRPISTLPDAFLVLGKGATIGIPNPFLFLILLFILYWIFLYKLKIGRYIYAVGGNKNAALVSGINVKFVTMFVYLLSGFACGLAAIILTARVSSAMPAAGESYELDAIAATVIGGTSLAGGRGRLWGTILGALLLGMVNNGMDLLNVSSYYQQIVKGVIILGAILLDSRREHN